MSWLTTRVGKLEGALAVGALTARSKPREVRILLTEKEWEEVPLDSLVHVAGKVFRYVGEYDPVSSTFRGEEVDLPYDRSWGRQPIDYVVLDI